MIDNATCHTPHPLLFYQRSYHWKGDQGLSEHTCVLGATSPYTVQYPVTESYICKKAFA